MMNPVRKWIVRGVLTLALLLAVSVLLFPSLYFSRQTRTTANLMLHAQRDFLLYEGEFPVWEQGAVCTVRVRPRYTTTYGVGFDFRLMEPLEDVVFGGRIQVQLLHEGSVVKTLAFGPGEPLYFGNSTWISIVPVTFHLPLEDRYWDDLAIRITMLEPASELERYKDGMVMRITNAANL